MNERTYITPVQAVRREGHTLVIDKCIFCGREHLHGAGGEPGPDYGHRVAHCALPQSKAATRGYRLVEAPSKR